MQADPGRPGLPGDLPGRQPGVVVQGDGASLPVGQAGDGSVQRVGPVQVFRRGRAVSGGRVEGFRPVGQQRRLGPAVLGTADVEHDGGQPAGEPLRIAQPVQRDERLQERFLHHVIHVAGIAAQAPGASAHHRLVPLDQQPERRRVTITGQHHEVGVRDLRAHRATLSSGWRSAIRPTPVSVMPNRMMSASSGTCIRTSYLVQSQRPATVTP